MDTFTFTYTPQQQESLDAIKGFLAGSSSVFILRGYAGTGKTTLIRPIIDLAADAGRLAKLMAPTGRAAKILSDKTKVEATTIHKGIYSLSEIKTVEGDESNESRIEYHFPLAQLCDQAKAGSPASPDKSLIIVDESSMISSRKSNSDLFFFGSGVLIDDILEYADLDNGGKILFVGDPAQLPPVGDSESFALEDQFFKAKNISVESYELTDVVRQQSDSAILSNSVKIRSMIGVPVRTTLVLDRKEGEVEDIKAEDIPARFCQEAPSPEIGGPVVICFSNKAAAAYNSRIRHIYFPDSDTIHVGDKIIITGNNYSSTDRNVLNGEFAMVTEVSDTVETQTGIVYVNKGGDKKEKMSLVLTFRQVELLFEDGIRTKRMIFDSLLGSSQPNITYQEQCALVSNFRMRHSGLKNGSEEYKHALMTDPYYNAVRAKYGYAVTCHKAQGGEWDTTFVDFSWRIGLNRDCLRWSYTAATRARSRMFGYLLHSIPPMTVRINETVTVSNVPAEYYPVVSDVPAGPFSTTAEPALVRARYFQVASHLEGTPYNVKNIEHKPYREIYVIGDCDGKEYRFDSTYNKVGMMKPFIPQCKEETPDDLAQLMLKEEEISIPFTYVPSNRNLEDLYSKVASLCDDNGIVITNIAEHLNSYKVSYYLKTDAAFAYLDVCVNKFGQVTYVAPRSSDGSRDVKLAGLVEGLRN